MPIEQGSGEFEPKMVPHLCFEPKLQDGCTATLHQRQRDGDGPRIKEWVLSKIEQSKPGFLIKL